MNVSGACNFDLENEVPVERSRNRLAHQSVSFLFLSKTPQGLLTPEFVRHSLFVVVHHKVSGSDRSVTVRPRIARFHTKIHIDQLYSHAGYDVTTCFRSEVIANKPSKMPPPMASGVIYGERFKRGITQYCKLIGDYRPHNRARYDFTNCFRPNEKCN